ncbi:MAG: sugar phosphate isomerase/epimerase family protein [Christensenellales bacterium]|jgi:sugar phosphate isomerase/epimerase
MFEIGLQTYTVKKLITTPKTLKETFLLIADKGVKHIELAIDYLKFPYTEDTFRLIKDTADQCGIATVSCQIRYNKVIKDYDKTVKIFNILDAKNLTISVIDIKLLLKGYEGIKAFCNNLNALYDRLSLDGISLGHHNHHYEFINLDGTTVMDIMADNFKGKFVLDTYWIARGGVNHLVLLEKLKGRVDILHLRDYKLKFKKFDLLGTDAEAGAGNLPFKEIIGKAIQCGAKYGMIEQSTSEPLESLTKSYNYLTKL